MSRQILTRSRTAIFVAATTSASYIWNNVILVAENSIAINKTYNIDFYHIYILGWQPKMDGNTKWRRRRTCAKTHETPPFPAHKAKIQVSFTDMKLWLNIDKKYTGEGIWNLYNINTLDSCWRVVRDSRELHERTDLIFSSF